VTVPSTKEIDFAYRTRPGRRRGRLRQHSPIALSFWWRWRLGIGRMPTCSPIDKPATVDVVSVDPKGVVVPNVPVTLSLIHVQWNSVRRAEGSGFYTWETERIETSVGEWNTTTGSAPVPVKVTLPEAGIDLDAFVANIERELILRSLERTGGNKGQAARLLKLKRTTLARSDVEPGEKARDDPGRETATALSPSSEGIRHYERFTLTSTQQTVEIPITEADIPNIYVSVLLVRGRTSNDRR
jgi:uncharacterized protein YfaS (alpha-2-macroglobulin family)